MATSRRHEPASLIGPIDAEGVESKAIVPKNAIANAHTYCAKQKRGVTTGLLLEELNARNSGRHSLQCENVVYWNKRQSLQGC